METTEDSRELFKLTCIMSALDALHLIMERREQGTNARKVNCGFVYSAYTLKPVLSGRTL